MAADIMADRTEDMGTTKRLRLFREDDGDIIVSIVTGRGLPMMDTTDQSETKYAEVQFCAPSGGGGHSPRTWAALGALMKAMKEDEADRPDLHRPKNAIEG